jgi:hypothetical protein
VIEVPDRKRPRLEQEIGVGGLLESGAEGRTDPWAFRMKPTVSVRMASFRGRGELARARVERGKQPIFGQHLRVGQRVQQRALPAFV